MKGFASGVAQRDTLIAAALSDERRRQQNQLELIASENIVSRAVLDALGHEITNKTLEGYPGARFHAGGRYADVIERAAVERACELFDCAYANVQPHSGSQANLALFFALLSPEDSVAQSRSRRRRTPQSRPAREPVGPLVRSPPLRRLARHRDDRLRRSVAAVTTRGLGETEMEEVGQVIGSVLTSDGTGEIVDEAKRTVAKLCQAFPIHAGG